METPSIVRAKKAAAAVNQIKATGNEFLTEDLIIQLQKNGCPYPKNMPRILERQGLVKKVKGITTFLYSEPVFHGLLVAELDKSSVNCRKYTIKSLNKKKGNDSAPTIEIEAGLESVPLNLLIEEIKRRGDFTISQKLVQIINY
jgi:glutaredoxin